MRCAHTLDTGDPCEWPRWVHQLITSHPFCEPPVMVPADQLEAMVKLLEPDHLTPAGARQIRALLAEARQ